MPAKWTPGVIWCASGQAHIWLGACLPVRHQAITSSNDGLYQLDMNHEFKWNTYQNTNFKISLIKPKRFHSGLNELIHIPSNKQHVLQHRYLCRKWMVPSNWYLCFQGPCNPFGHHYLIHMWHTSTQKHPGDILHIMNSITRNKAWVNLLWVGWKILLNIGFTCLLIGVWHLMVTAHAAVYWLITCLCGTEWRGDYSISNFYDIYFESTHYAQRGAGHFCGNYMLLVALKAPYWEIDMVFYCLNVFLLPQSGVTGNILLLWGHFIVWLSYDVIYIWTKIDQFHRCGHSQGLVAN